MAPEELQISNSAPQTPPQRPDSPPQRSEQPDPRQYAPATGRNRDPILAVLQQVLPPSGTVLEISSGTGEHAVYFAPRLPHLTWLPTEPAWLDSIEAWIAAQPSPNLLPPQLLDVEQSPWPVEQQPPTPPITALVNINMLHIAPWSACLGLMAGAGRILPVGGLLYLYGPYKRQGKHTADSNEAFDASLRTRDPSWGVRDLEAVVEAAQQQGFALSQVVEMPANNYSVILKQKAVE
jgi:hypothetical protein